MLLVLITGLPGTGKSTMAEEAGRTLGAPVLGHDWAMSGLRPFPEIQEALDAMGLRGHRGVGWSLLWALARSQLRAGLLGRARRRGPCARGRGNPSGGARGGRDEPRGHDRVSATPDCTGRGSKAGSARFPAGTSWTGPHVARARESWDSPDDVDLVVEAGDPMEENGGAGAGAVAQRSAMRPAGVGVNPHDPR